MDRPIRDIRLEFGAAGGSEPLGLDEYQHLAAKTDKSGLQQGGGKNFLLLGLFGEAGSLLSELKKKHLGDSAYFAYADSALEELGDVLWYFANVAHKQGHRLSDIANASAEPSPPELVPRHFGAHTFADLQPQGKLFSSPIAGPKVQGKLLTLAAKAAALMQCAREDHPDAEAVRSSIYVVFRAIVEAAGDAEISLEQAATRNLDKVVSRWPIEPRWGRRYDEEYDEDERFPRYIEITFKEKLVRGTPYVIQKCKGINIGDRLTDNRREPDDYRFHDVFHISYAAFLGWSPVLRALFKLKRKSDDRIDEQQDGARAIIAEEGIANWIFAQGWRHEYFEHVTSLDFALLKTIRDMVKGYEVEDRPYWMWERAILEGFRIFRALKRHRGGAVIADLESRTIEYRATDLRG